jgi:hypothetical protein
MRTPTVHLNGSHPDQLMDALMNTHASLEEALDNLALAAPHARDYYPQGDEAFYEARDEHASRVQRLRSVAKEILDIALAVDRQASERRRSRSNPRFR